MPSDAEYKILDPTLVCACTCVLTNPSLFYFTPEINLESSTLGLTGMLSTGECNRCHARPWAQAVLDKMVAEALQEQRQNNTSKDPLNVLAALPACKRCDQGDEPASKVTFNGCYSCGYSFASTSWSALPPYRPPEEDKAGDRGSWASACGWRSHESRRQAFVNRVRRERQAARSVAALYEQVQDEALALMHKQRALRDELRRIADRRVIW